MVAGVVAIVDSQHDGATKRRQRRSRGRAQHFAFEVLEGPVTKPKTRPKQTKPPKPPCLERFVLPIALFCAIDFA